MKKSVRKNRMITAAVITAAAAVFAVLGLTVFRPQLKAAVRAASGAVSGLRYRKYLSYPDTDGKTVIRIDPGHGGSDPGATSGFLGDVTESDINRRLARQRARQRLTDLRPDILHGLSPFSIPRRRRQSRFSPQ